MLQESGYIFGIFLDFEGVPFLITSDESLMKSEKAKDGSIVLYKNFDEEKVVYDGKSKEKVSPDCVLENHIFFNICFS